MKRGKGVLIAREELKKEGRDSVLYYVLVSGFIIFLILFLAFAVMHLLEITGYASIISEAGYVTKMDVFASKPVTIWGGIYGLVLRVPEFTQRLYQELENGTIERADVFFDCIQSDAQGGPEVYASTNSELNLLSMEIRPGTTAMVDELINCNGEVFCANETFTKNMTIYVGSANITNIPSTHTFRYDGRNNVFDIGVLNVSGNLVFVSHVNATIQKGYNPNIIVNYQMLLPTPANSTQTFYFYNDPNDVCPSGGIGNTINASIYGYILNSSGGFVGGAKVTVAGFSTFSNSDGFYNLSTLVLEGSYSYVVQADGFNNYIDGVNVSFSNYTIYKNASLEPEVSVPEETKVSPLVYGRVTDTGSNVLSGVSIYLGNFSTASDSSGLYSFRPVLAVGQYPLIAIKQNYDNYFTLLNISINTSSINKDIIMEPANLNLFPSGPYSEEGVDEEEGDETEKAKEIAEELGQDFWVSTTEINKQVRENTFIEESVSIYNFRSSPMQVFFSVSSEIQDILKLDKGAITVTSNSFVNMGIIIYGTKPIGIYRGIITLTGDLNIEIPVKIEILPKKLPVEMLELKVDLFNERIRKGGKLKYRVSMQNLITEQKYKIALKHMVLDSNGTRLFIEEDETVEIKDSLILLKEIKLLENLSNGEYLVSVEAYYFDQFSSVNLPFEIYSPLYLYSFFGIPLWSIFIGISAFSFILLNVFLYNRHIQKKKRYHLALRIDLLPKAGERAIKIGKIAERNIPAYYNLDDFTVHSIVAGATGGGKSIAAQVLVEEALMKNIAVIVFDPTAQWSGLLRKCDDKRMLAFYPKFGLSQKNARAFPGNVRQITNYLESIDIKKYMAPGQIQIFTLNKLTPPQIDTFVAGIISNIFKSDPQEYPGLRLMLVFDEVHRLLPKFGGSGKGFLQIERACREFRKWGFGVMLVSQVLSDFVGEIKANINTEIQMRVAEENDLERIRERYGIDALKSLVRADVGTGMVQNAEYNKGLPYFINFRPILHNTRRLSDEELNKYNKYNETINDLEYEVEQLGKENVDIFDLKMELKLVKDKLMTGNFSVVDIYLEGLKPRVEKQWEKLGKKPKKREIELINEKELESSVAKAQEERKKWEKEQKTEVIEEKKEEDKRTKIVAPLILDNGMMASSLNELKDILPGLDKAIFRAHVNDEKNDISAWVSKEIDAGLGEKLKACKNKESMLNAIGEFGKEEKPKSEKGKDEKEKKEDGELKK